LPSAPAVEAPAPEASNTPDEVTAPVIQVTPAVSAGDLAPKTLPPAAQPAVNETVASVKLAVAPNSSPATTVTDTTRSTPDATSVQKRPQLPSVVNPQDADKVKTKSAKVESVPEQSSGKQKDSHLS
jgi:hypothetical protein